jgi:hypothetical protein
MKVLYNGEECSRVLIEGAEKDFDEGMSSVSDRRRVCQPQ